MGFGAGRILGAGREEAHSREWGALRNRTPPPRGLGGPRLPLHPREVAPSPLLFCSPAAPRSAHVGSAQAALAAPRSPGAPHTHCFARALVGQNPPQSLHSSGVQLHAAQLSQLPAAPTWQRPPASSCSPAPSMAFFLLLLVLPGTAQPGSFAAPSSCCHPCCFAAGSPRSAVPTVLLGFSSLSPSSQGICCPSVGAMHWNLSPFRAAGAQQPRGSWGQQFWSRATQLCQSTRSCHCPTRCRLCCRAAIAPSAC